MRESDMEDGMRNTSRCPECGCLRGEDHADDCPFNEEGETE